MSMNTEWAIEELEEFVTQCREHSDIWGKTEQATAETEALHDHILGRMPIVAQIADRVWPGWREHVPAHIDFDWQYDPLLQIAQQVLVMLRRKEELEQNLGEAGLEPSMSALHPEVWDAAKALWQDGLFGDAAVAAGKRLNAALQAKAGRQEITQQEALHYLTAFSVLARWIAAEQGAR